ncbi:alpha-L-fucosidase [Microbacterium sp. R86528]|uniref:alpha-L-fucosidase n=1 Tax=Microbacterium sp. R86528 TaxID=3093864 RepID=UPI0037C90EF9
MTDIPDAGQITFAQDPQSQGNPALGWFREARFGMFVHWGVYAIPAGYWNGEPTPHMGEWIMHDLKIPAEEYKQLAASFDPHDFDAAALVDLAVRAGQRYLVLTAKHHDGFCLWDTELTTFSSAVDAPLGRDIVGEISQACRDRGIKFGLYYSQTQDWTHPDAAGNDWDFDPETQDFESYLQGYVKPQLTELLTGYGEIALIWFDTPQGITAEQSRDLVEHVHMLQPYCLVNGRVGNGLGDYGQTRDNEMPDEPAGDWETPITGNGTWGFTDNTEWKSAREISVTIAKAVSRGGNVLLNVGPDSRGAVPSAQVVELETIGDWLQRCGASIYGTHRGPFRALEWGWSTASSDHVYLLVENWPAHGELVLPANVSVESARLLTDAGGTSLEVRGAQGGAVVDLNGVEADAVLSVIELTGAREVAPL